MPKFLILNMMIICGQCEVKALFLRISFYHSDKSISLWNFYTISDFQLENNIYERSLFCCAKFSVIIIFGILTFKTGKNKFCTCI